MTEILAPAGGRGQLIAAVRSGANAVYLGARGFNARRNAENFDELGLEEAVSYCHARDVKVHVAVNTLVTDVELPALLETLKSVADCGADAVIVQDLAVARLLKERCPELPMHASTQMTVHNLAGVRVLKELGFSRAVLARELSLEEIKLIADGTDMELECFVHGALCMCVSGGCYLSSMLGGRSGNRGLCAQPCRLDFHSGEREYALSLKDMTAVGMIRELAGAGVCSLKIEGRMKRPEYVAAAVTACRMALEGQDPDMDTLRSVFSRGGFTDGYLTGRRTLDMFGHREREDVTAAARVLRPLAAIYKDETARVPVSMRLTMEEGTPSTLSVTDGERTVTVAGPVPERAETRATDRALTARSLSKCGGTPFYLEDFDLVTEGEPVLPARELNELRRRALEELLSHRSEIRPRPFAELPLSQTEKRAHSATPELRVRAEKYEQLGSDCAADAVILPIMEIEAHPEAIAAYGGRLFAELPALVWPRDEVRLAGRLAALRVAGVGHAVVENLGALELAREAHFTLHGGHGLNILNTPALEEYERLGLEDATVSFEISMARLSAMKGSLPRGILAAGRLPLMRCRACPIQGENGCSGCPGHGVLTDRRGARFPVICTARRYVTVLNSVPLWLGDREVRGADFVTVYFTNETPAQCRAQLEAFERALPYPGEHTGGLYFREVK